MSRKALRDFYRLQADAASAAQETATTKTAQVVETDPQELIDRASAADLVELVRTHRELVAEKQVLDSDQKALIYNNYKKLIEASEKLDGIDSHSALMVDRVCQDIDKIAAALASTTRSPILGAHEGFAQLRNRYAGRYALE